MIWSPGFYRAWFEIERGAEITRKALELRQMAGLSVALRAAPTRLIPDGQPCTRRSLTGLGLERGIHNPKVGVSHCSLSKAILILHVHWMVVMFISILFVCQLFWIG